MPLLRCMDRNWVGETFLLTGPSQRWEMILATSMVVAMLAGEEAATEAVVETVHHLGETLIASSAGELDTGLENALQLVEVVLEVDRLLVLGLKEALEVEDVVTVFLVVTAMVIAMWMIGMMAGAMGTVIVLITRTIGMAAVDAIAMKVIATAVIGTHPVAIATMEAAVEATSMVGVLTVTLRTDMERKGAMIEMVQGEVVVAGMGPVVPCVMRVEVAIETGQHPMIVLEREGAHLMIADHCVSTLALLLILKAMA